MLQVAAIDTQKPDLLPPRVSARHGQGAVWGPSLHERRPSGWTRIDPPAAVSRARLSRGKMTLECRGEVISGVESGPGSDDSRIGDPLLPTPPYGTPGADPGPQVSGSHRGWPSATRCPPRIGLALGRGLNPHPFGTRETRTFIVATPLKTLLRTI